MRRPDCRQKVSSSGFQWLIQYDAVAGSAGGMSISPRVASVTSRLKPDLDAAGAHADRIDRQAHQRIVQTGAGFEIEALLVDRRGDLEPTGGVPDDAARDHEGLA